MTSEPGSPQTTQEDVLGKRFKMKQDDVLAKTRNFAHWMSKIVGVDIKNVDTEITVESITAPILQVTGDKQIQAAVVGRNLGILKEMIRMEIGKREGKETPFYLDMLKPLLQDPSAAASLNAEQILLALSQQDDDTQAKFFLYLEYFSGGWQLD